MIKIVAVGKIKEKALRTQIEAVSYTHLDVYKRQVYVVSDGGGIEPQLQEALMLYREKLEGRHRFISDGDAAKMIENDDLLIAVDHHLSLIHILCRKEQLTVLLSDNKGLDNKGMGNCRRHGLRIQREKKAGTCK